MYICNTYINQIANIETFLSVCAYFLDILKSSPETLILTANINTLISNDNFSTLGGKLHSRRSIL